FRVKCENLGGQSDYSEETTPIIPATAVDIRAPAFKEELRNMSVKYKRADQAVVKKEIATLNLAKHTNFLLLHESFDTEFEPENIVYTTRTSSNVKIIELGQSRHLTPGDQIKVQYTTAEYAAPEIHQCDMVSTVTDMWSVGVLAYVLLSGLNPFTAETNQQMIDNISNAAYSYDDESFMQFSVEALDFTDRLMTKDRKHRMTAAEALVHPWLTKPVEEISNRAIPTGRHKRYYQTMAVSYTHLITVNHKYRSAVSTVKSPEPIKSPQRVKSPVSPKSPTPKSPTPKSPTPKSPTPSEKERVTSPIKSPKRVMSPTLEKKPAFSVSLSDVTATSDSIVKLSVKVTGEPKPAISWLKNGKVTL
uniref:Protein kinase domain-containing protein n=1 Tax=Seriola lalandi dorsalis TaxID=1841481 RepID=A0A3B4WMI0_SERLL